MGRKVIYVLLLALPFLSCSKYTGPGFTEPIKNDTTEFLKFKLTEDVPNEGMKDLEYKGAVAVKAERLATSGNTYKADFVWLFERKDEPYKLELTLPSFKGIGKYGKDQVITDAILRLSRQNPVNLTWEAVTTDVEVDITTDGRYVTCYFSGKTKHVENGNDKGERPVKEGVFVMKWDKKEI